MMYVCGCGGDGVSSECEGTPGVHLCQEMDQIRSPTYGI